ncbi:Uncharacterized protein TCM_026005 [Theobroma cacao]|uniref:Uncharacterized protein n=1 Tax=Theobroma cacao TaxID=3641 RepID=A0A061F100_THECC|nr:Uncharacterized protein TCM_026005 [Theobroma cacao]
MTSFPWLPHQHSLSALIMTSSLALLRDLPLALTLTYPFLRSSLVFFPWLPHRYPRLAPLFAFAVIEIHDLTMISFLASSLGSSVDSHIDILPWLLCSLLALSRTIDLTMTSFPSLPYRQPPLALTTPSSWLFSGIFPWLSQ